MLSAKDKPWNSPTTLYIARKIQAIANGQKIAVLDMGCGDGTILEFLLDDGYDLYGYDFLECAEALRKKIQPHFGESYEHHIRFMEDEKTIPFSDNSFDVLYANQVFEHVRFFSQMISECARVLKPNGVLLVNFPLATNLSEPHLDIPFAHWMPPGNARVSYLYPFYAFGLKPKLKECSARETAISQNKYLQYQTYYRFLNEVQSVSEFYFREFELETNLFINAKLDMMSNEKKIIKRWLASFLRLFEGKILDSVVTNFVNAAFCIKYPKKESIFLKKHVE